VLPPRALIRALPLALCLASGCHARLAPVPVVGSPAAPMTGNRPPTATIASDSPSVAPGQAVTLSAEVYDADGDALSLKWSAPSGQFNNPAGARTRWTAPATPGPVTITFSADDGRGGVAKATLTVTVAGP
jgi:hypothetical protein